MGNAVNSALISLRQEEIYNYIAQCNIVTIEDISKALHISQSTIRRDLKLLEEQRRITSFHGGVSVNSGYGTFVERTTRNISEKQAIARPAVAMVEAGDVIYVGGGSSTYEFAISLARKNDLANVSIVTSAMNIAKCFVHNKIFKVIVPGGGFEAEDESMTSKITMDILRNFNFDKAFVGSQAVNAQQGYTIPNYKLSELKKVVVAHAKRLILLCDHSKIGKISPYTVCGIRKVDILITDQCSKNAAEIRNIKQAGVEVVCVTP